MRNDKYNYDQFVNLSFELVDLMITKKGCPTMTTKEQNINRYNRNSNKRRNKIIIDNQNK
jgi:hypothetical protein